MKKFDIIYRNRYAIFMHLVSKLQFSKLAGTTQAGVGAACRTILKNAVVDGLLNVEHPDAIKYIENQITRRQYLAVGRRKQSGVKPAVPVDDRPPPLRHPPPRPGEDIDPSKYLDMTLREIGDLHGTAPALVEYLRAVREIERIHETRLKNGEREGTLVTRHLVRVGVIDPFDRAFTQLLTDGARSIARQLKTMYESGADVIEAERWVSDRIGSFVRGTKEKTIKALEYADRD